MLNNYVTYRQLPFLPKVSRILICGRVSLCREVFGESVNEGRDPDRGHSDRYTTRFYLKHK